ncbi:MAG: polyphosphate polymerase domain-containing protein [Kiritimatiellae bacterium]|nr:polyphosphate polymerase domain-containing protein [Kiritimatiellia bacterium]
MAESKNKRKGIAQAETIVERHEAKYLIPYSLVKEIRSFIKPFCDPDFNGKGEPPEYVINTLQLDGPSMPLHYAKEREALTRFKLRVRTYGMEVGKAPVFLEIKRKYGAVVVKSRTSIPFEAWTKELMENRTIKIKFRSEREAHAFIEFRRLAQEIGARPVVIIRYIRESYFGRNDHYARITFDRALEYQPTKSWNSWGRGGRWYSMDAAWQQNKSYPFSACVLEIKTLADAPQWMMDLVQRFNLTRMGNCKYSTAIWQEALFRGTPEIPDYACELFLT